MFWHNIDPLVKDRQFCDRGDQYRTRDLLSRRRAAQLAEASKKAVQAKLRAARSRPRSSRPDTFYKAEDYHQDYYEKNPVRYKFYRYNCGRDQRLEELWGKKDRAFVN